MAFTEIRKTGKLAFFIFLNKKGIRKSSVILGVIKAPGFNQEVLNKISNKYL